ncbi:hypothetical protein L1049_022062 [Liquidambar formosana]|uniref:Uncharacterized protein n=1 Tax=Liquidambar formosana TaxID=63359 RepID=A0AAP0WQL8_LIQFO
MMEVEFVANGLSEDDPFQFGDDNDDSTFEGERCGICMDIIIDRGVLDCCQHWFCFLCIDNWASITNLCPLCQNEFQLITCVPVYDTIGSNKVDDDSFSREDDWCIEGKNNTLSFPSYYIDENAVICLDGDGCKIRSGSATIEEDSNLDTSIACDSCDMWYHAFCVGFDPENTSESTWLCPRCVVDKMPQKSDVTSIQSPSNQCGPENADSECLVEADFSRKVSVSVADAGETAVVVSMVGGNQWTEVPSKNFLSTPEVGKDLKIETFILSSDADSPKVETLSNSRTNIQPNLEAQGLELSLSHDTSFSLPSTSLVLSEVKTNGADKAMNEQSGFDGFSISSRNSFGEFNIKNSLSEGGSSIGLHLGLSVGSYASGDDGKNDGTGDQAVVGVQLDNSSEEPFLSADKIVPDATEDVVGITGIKRKHVACRDDVCTSAENGEIKAKIDTKVSTKKLKVREKIQIIPSNDEAIESVSDDSKKCPSLIAVSKYNKLRHDSEKEDVTSDIMSIVQVTSRKPIKGLASSNPADKSSEERENAAGLRVKKIMRGAAEDKESSMLVQKLRKEIREAVRNKSSKEFGKALFDPKLLAAFRAAVAGTEPAKKLSPLVVKAKKSMLQKGKVRDNLTKKIYGTSNGRRRHAWDRDCEIEFWKHRCIRTTKPEKIETLKSVLDLLRKNPEGAGIEQQSELRASNPILSRLYLADTSVFPRKGDIKPLLAVKEAGKPEQNKEQHTSLEFASKLSLDNRIVKTPEPNNVSLKVAVPLFDSKGNKNSALSLKGDTALTKLHPNRTPEAPSVSQFGGSKANSQKEMVGKSDDIKSDKRKWALEVLARKTAVAGGNATHEKQQDNAAFKGNYPLLAQLPVDMRPLLAPSRHNKIPISVRQAQLYRLTEHFLRKANLPVIHRTADTELAVADAVNIEKEVADRANSKLVYVNLCSQELLRRSDNNSSNRAAESNPSPLSAASTERSEQANIEPSSDPVVEEALRTAGLLSDSPPNSPRNEMRDPSEEDDPSVKIREEEPDNVFEMDSHPELDIYGDFEYDLEGEDYIGANAVKVSKLQPEEGESKLKVVFSTLTSDGSNNAPNFEDHERQGIDEMPKDSSCMPKCQTDTGFRSSTTEGITDESCCPLKFSVGGDEEPSLAECEELYGPDKAPLIEKFPEVASRKPYGLVGAEALAENKVPGKNDNCRSNQTVRPSEFDSGSPAENLFVATVGHNSSVGENSPNHSQKGENVHMEKKSDTNKQSDSGNSVSKKVEAYIKEHIRPLCKSGVITVEQYRYAVAKTTDKVMKFHAKSKNASFLIKEGEKVKKLAEQYVEAAQQAEKK